MASNALYISIYQELLHDIQSGKYIENEPLPSEESLCRSYNVSRTTVHKALDMLKDADVVYSVQGNGAYVKPHMFAQPLSKFYSFTEEPQLVADFVALNFYCEKHPESPFNKQEMFALKTLDGRRTLDGNLYKEIHNGTVTARELRPEEMPEAYARFGLAYGK